MDKEFDDMDSGDWEEFLSGPDDGDIEILQEKQVYNEEFDADEYYDEGYDDEGYDEYDEYDDDKYYERSIDYTENLETNGINNQDSEEVSRTEEIVTWLAESKIAKIMKKSLGFYVIKGQHVRLIDGSVVDVIDWLFEEGIKDGVTVAEYNVVYTKPGSKFKEKLTFFNNIIDAPFMPNPTNNSEDDSPPF